MKTDTKEARRIVEAVPTNTGHGHVFKRPDGRRDRCGGPNLCAMCANDQARRALAFGREAILQMLDDLDQQTIEIERWREAVVEGSELRRKEISQKVEARGALVERDQEIERLRARVAELVDSRTDAAEAGYKAGHNNAVDGWSLEVSREIAEEICEQMDAERTASNDAKPEAAS